MGHRGTTLCRHCRSDQAVSMAQTKSPMASSLVQSSISSSALINATDVGHRVDRCRRIGQCRVHLKYVVHQRGNAAMQSQTHGRNTVRGDRVLLPTRQQLLGPCGPEGGHLRRALLFRRTYLAQSRLYDLLKWPLQRASPLAVSKRGLVRLDSQVSAPRARRIRCGPLGVVDLGSNAFSRVGNRGQSGSSSVYIRSSAQRFVEGVRPLPFVHRMPRSACESAEGKEGTSTVGALIYRATRPPSWTAPSLRYEPDLEIECIHTSTGYTLFVLGIHTGYTL